ncbi:MAG: endonuclease/exonuclease/phosphatase family protein [archaeon]
MDKLKIISLNIWGLPWPFSPSLKTRFKKIVKFLKKENPDIIFLQECWFFSHVKKLKKEFPNYYFSHYKRFLIGNQSGLVTMTKKKPLGIKFFMFPRPTTERVDEFVSGKGILVTEIKLNGSNIFLINTHTFSRLYHKHKEVLFNQLKILKRIIKKYPSLIFVGDLNLTEKEFSNWNENFMSYVFPKNPALDPKNPYRKKAPLHFLEEGNTPTFIAVKTNPLITKVKTEVLDKIYLSDHQPLISEISFFR